MDKEKPKKLLLLENGTQYMCVWDEEDLRQPSPWQAVAARVIQHAKEIKERSELLMYLRETFGLNTTTTNNNNNSNNSTSSSSSSSKTPSPSAAASASTDPDVTVALSIASDREVNEEVTGGEGEVTLPYS